MNSSDLNAKNILLGSGGHARALLGLIRECGLPLMGCVSPQPPDSKWQKECPWLGDDDALEGFIKQSVKVVNGIGSTRSTALRRNIFNKIRQRGFYFGSLVHPSAIIAQEVMFSEGVQVFPRVIIQPGVKIADNVLLNSGCIIEHECEIGAHSHIAPGAVLSGGVIVGVGVHLGASSAIIQGARIGDNAIVGMGAVVLNDVPDNTIVVGNPARTLNRTHPN